MGKYSQAYIQRLHFQVISRRARIIGELRLLGQTSTLGNREDLPAQGLAESSQIGSDLDNMVRYGVDGKISTTCSRCT